MTHQRSNMRKSHWALAAAVAAVPLLAAALPARAQYPVQNDGRARDANNRIGSGGYNDAGGIRTPTVTGNQIVNGNVTNGKEFHGSVPYTDARSFRGATSGGLSDRFVAGSSGAPTRTTANLSNTYTALPFYGESRAVAPPAGFAPLSYSGGYTSAAAPGQVTAAANPYQFGGSLSRPPFVPGSRYT